MLVSLSWLQEICDVDRPAREVADILTARGLTVDAVSAYMCPGGISPATRDATVQLVSDPGTPPYHRVSAAALGILCSPEFLRF